jgi:hypothetical protein
MKEQQGTTEARKRTVIMEVMMMILHSIQFFALEEAAHQQDLSVAQLLRRAIADFLQQPESISGG